MYLSRETNSDHTSFSDFFGAWSPTTGVNAPLYYQGWGDEDFNVAACVENWMAGGGTPDKINIGLPFYGRSYLNAKGLNEPHSGADKNIWGIDDGTPQYFNIVSKLPSMTQMWDEKTWTQIAYFEGGGLVSFDNENAICAKIEFMQKHNLNGGIIWELSGDVLEDLSTPLLDVINEKLLNPEMSCGQPGEVVTTPLISVGSSSAAVVSSSSSTPSSTSSFQPGEAVGSSSAVSSSSSSSSSSMSSSAFGSSSSLAGTFVSNDSASGQPILLFCGGKQDSLNIINAETLVLSFTYELHRPVEGVSEPAAIRSLKKVMLKSIADKLQCGMGDSTLGRLLRTKDAHQQIVAVEASLHDTPNKNSPCTIPINHAVPTICHSMIGSMKAYFSQGTPAQILTNARDELLFFIRTTMSSGAYESADVRKVVYIEDLSVGAIHSNPPTNSHQVLVWQENDTETSSSSLLIGAVVVLSVAFVGLLGLLLISRRTRRGTIWYQSPHNQVGNSVPLGVEDENSEDLESVWQKALHTYDKEGTIAEEPAGVANDGRIGIAGMDRNVVTVAVAVEPEGALFKPHANTECEPKAPTSEMEKATTETLAVSVESSSVEEDEDEIKESISNEVHDDDEEESQHDTTSSDENERDIDMDEEEKESSDHQGDEGEGNFVIVSNDAVPDTRLD